MRNPVQLFLACWPSSAGCSTNYLWSHGVIYIVGPRALSSAHVQPYIHTQSFYTLSNMHAMYDPHYFYTVTIVICTMYMYMYMYVLYVQEYSKA